MGKLYRFLGLTCAAVQSNDGPAKARAAFAADVTYVTGQVRFGNVNLVFFGK